MQESFDNGETYYLQLRKGFPDGILWRRLYKSEYKDRAICCLFKMLLFALGDNDIRFFGFSENETDEIADSIDYPDVEVVQFVLDVLEKYGHIERKEGCIHFGIVDKMTKRVKVESQLRNERRLQQKEREASGQCQDNVRTKGDVQTDNILTSAQRHQDNVHIKENNQKYKESYSNNIAHPSQTPSFLELKDFWKEEGYTTDIWAFYNEFNAKGWTLNGQPCQDWRELAKTWNIMNSTQREGGKLLANTN